MEKICIKDFPKYLLDEITKEISWYSVALVCSENPGEKEKPILVGSGTLINLHQYYGILTANHVAEEVKKYPALGLCYGKESNQMMWKESLFFKQTIATAQNASEGPDLAIIRIPDNILGQVKAIKSFYNLENHKERILNENLITDNSYWSMFGAIYELCTIDPSNEQYRITFMCYGSKPPRIYKRDDYDYFEVTAYYDKDTSTPASFGGMSGGGFWRVKITRQGEKLKISDHAKLIGISFYQDPLVENKRTVRGHGAKSIYKNVYDFIKQNLV